MKIKLTNVRLSFPELFTAKAGQDGGEPAFTANFLLDPADPQIGMVNAAINQVAKDKWGAKAEAVLKQMRAADKVCLHDGDTKAQYAGYEGNMFVASRSKTRPLVIDRDKSPLTEADGKPYSGCYVNVTLDLWAQDNSFGKRVNAQLGGVQFCRDGDAFSGGGSVADADDFEAITEGADAESLV
jgi:hypothetical protein